MFGTVARRSSATIRCRCRGLPALAKGEVRATFSRMEDGNLRVAGPTPFVRSLIVTARPRQWIKNLLVLAAPFAGGALNHPVVLRDSGTTFLSFCAVASGNYFVNDAADAERDRHHPTKRRRPVASGDITTRLARVIGGFLLAAGIATSILVSVRTAGIIALYVLLTVSYSHWLKHVAVVDIVVVACGFLLRAIAGSVAAGVPVSGPFLAFASFGALFLVVGKREGERIGLGDAAVVHRPSIAAYSAAFTAQLLSLSLTATVLSFASWAFNTDAHTAGVPWLSLSVIPFVIAMLRATQLVLVGAGADPEELILRDRGTLVATVATAVFLSMGLYVV